MDHLRQIFSAKKKTKNGQASGWAVRTRVHNIRVYLLKTAWTFGIVRKNEYDIIVLVNDFVSV